MKEVPSEALRLERALVELPQALRQAAVLPLPGLQNLTMVSRRIFCSGLGSSSAHARFLVTQLVCAGVAAHAWALGGDGLGSGDTLVVFSQGLSAPVRRCISRLAPEVAVVLVTSVDPSRKDSGSLERRDWLAAAEAAGLHRVPMMGAMEYGSLLRITGPVTGYLTALRLANALGAARRIPLEEIIAAMEACLGREGQIIEPEVFDRELSLLGTGVSSDCLGNLALKVQEGLLQPAPPVLTIENVAHGPFQEAYPRPRTWVVFTCPGSEEEPEAVRRLREMLPAHQSVCEVPATMAFPWSIFSHEVLWTRAVLAHRQASGLSTEVWPGQGADGPLYDWGQAAPPPIERLPATPGLDCWTSPALQELLDGRPTTILVPLGSTEQHGPHLPLGTDSCIAEALAERICRRLPGAVRLPVMPFGIATEHLSFAGTISIEEETFIRFLCDLLRSLAAHGPADVMVFSAHGGNESCLARNRELLEAAVAPAGLILASIPDQVNARLVGLAAESGVAPGEAGWHAGELETSMMLGLAPALVRPEEFASGHTDLDLPAEKLFYPDLANRVPSGVVGDPRGASARRAEMYLSGWVEELLAFYRSRASVHQTNGTKKA